MFTCQVCGSSSSLYAKPERVVVATKVVDHRDGKGRGSQIMAEKVCCTACASKLRMQLRETQVASQDAPVAAAEAEAAPLTASVEQVVTS
jgi:hypothetical protein